MGGGFIVRRMSAEQEYVSGELPSGTRLGAWQVQRLIGRGGSGEVYVATRADGIFRQKAALKLLQHGAVAEASRFESERDILARLEHPGIARLLDGGVHCDGRPYMVMEYVEGTSLTEHCEAAHLDLAGRLRLFLEVCEVVSYAHRSLVVHRDLKPRNILVTREGRVKLLDFGVAKLLDTVALLATSEKTSAPLTPDYAAPEQLTGQTITTTTDVYALGVVLFELLTTRKPFKHTDLPMAQAVNAILHDAAPMPSRAARAGEKSAVPPRLLTGDLDAIVCKCLRKEPEHRYQSVGALQNDVQRYINTEPVLAREGARMYVLGRFLRRQRWVVAAAVTSFLALAAALAIVSWQAHNVALERDIARRAASREEAVRYYLTRMFRSSVANRGSEPTTAKAMLDRSAQRVLSEYRDDPYLAGKVVETLADLYGALADVEGQVPLLEGFLQHAGPEADPEALALVQQKLANVELQRGNIQRASDLIGRAQTFWETDNQRYAEQRLEGMVVRGRLQRTLNDVDGAIATYNSALQQRIALSGMNHPETAALYNSLAIAYTAASRFNDGIVAYSAALNIHKTLESADDLDALIMRANLGINAARYGQIDEAARQLKDAFQRQQELSGESAAVASAMGYYGAVLSARGQHEEAQTILRNAIRIAVQFTGEASPLSVLDRLFLAEAQTAAGHYDEAATTLAQALELARSKLGAEHLYVLRGRIHRARLAVLADEPAQGEAEILNLLVPLRAIGTTAQPTLATAFLVRGEALLAMHRGNDAIPPLAEAVRLREQLLWDQSWELAEARMLLAEALGTADPHARHLLAQALAVFESQLGRQHAFTVRAGKLLAEGEAAATTSF